MAKKPALFSGDVVDQMVEYVRENLELDDFGGPDSPKKKGSLIFTGRSVEDGSNIALEIITSMSRAVSEKSLDKRVAKRVESRLKSERTYTGILFPKSIDYSRATVEFRCPYFKQADLLKTIWGEKELKENYLEFYYNRVKELSRVEWSFALPLCGRRIAYYNSQKERIQVHKFRRFPERRIIPDNLALDKGYFWDFARMGFPLEGNVSRKAEVFRSIQEGLHDRVREMAGTENIDGLFTLASYGKAGAKFIQSDE